MPQMEPLFTATQMVTVGCNLYSCYVQKMTSFMVCHVRWITGSFCVSKYNFYRFSVFIHKKHKQSTRMLLQKILVTSKSLICLSSCETSYLCDILVARFYDTQRSRGCFAFHGVAAATQSSVAAYTRCAWLHMSVKYRKTFFSSFIFMSQINSFEDNSKNTGCDFTAC